VIARWTTALLALASCDSAFMLEREEVVLACPASFREVNGAYYQRFDDLVSWYEAEAACEALRDPALTGRTHLVVIASTAEKDAIQADLTVDKFWLGHTDLAEEAVFRPVSTEVVDWPPLTTPPWADTQPNNLGGNQHCVIVDNQNFLDDKKCASDTEPFRFVCECDLFDSDAPLPP
jgi:hypothetical protein